MFAANLTVQYSLNGTTWLTATGWTLSPSYSYTNTASGLTYSFTGAPIASVKGVRIVGQLTTTTSSSKRARVREVLAYSAQNASLPQSTTALAIVIESEGGGHIAAITRIELAQSTRKRIT